jgi:hypothetical protein
MPLCHCQLPAVLCCRGHACYHPAEALPLEFSSKLKFEGQKRAHSNCSMSTLTMRCAAQDSTSVALSPVLKICTSPAPAPPFVRGIADVASASRLLNFDAIDDDCQIQEKRHICSHPHAGLHCEEMSSGGGSDVSSFSLVGNVMHTGRTLDSGHYYADVVCNGSWIRVNDTSVNSIDWHPCCMQSPSWSNMSYIQMYACSSTGLSLRTHE